MPVPLLLDTDMGIDDAAATCLAFSSDAVDLCAVVGVGGRVGLDQVMANIARLFEALQPPRRPVIGRGLEAAGRDLNQPAGEMGADGFGEIPIPSVEAPWGEHFRTVYRDAIESAHGELVIVAIGPLTNLAAILQAEPDLLRGARQIVIRGGAIWTAGDASEHAEFNFRSDPAAAAALLASGLPITVVPLDVSNYIRLDESHAAHLVKSGVRTGQALGRMLAYPLQRGGRDGSGKVPLHDAVAVGGVLWPALFLNTRMRVEVTADGPNAGQCRPALGGDKSKQVNLLTAVNAVDLLENMLEALCHEPFVV